MDSMNLDKEFIEHVKHEATTRWKWKNPYLAALLALVFGPFGLVYLSWKKTIVGLLLVVIVAGLITAMGWTPPTWLRFVALVLFSAYAYIDTRWQNAAIEYYRYGLAGTGTQNPRDQKNIKFNEFEALFAGNAELISCAKALWLTGRACVEGNAGNLDQAIADLKEAIRYKSDYFPAFNLLGIAYRDKGMLDEAIATFTIAPRKMTIFGKSIGGAEFDFYSGLSSVYVLKGDREKSLEYAEKALAAASSQERNDWKSYGKEVGIDISDDDAQRIKALSELVWRLRALR